MAVFFALSAGMLVILCISINGRLAGKVGLIQAGITNYLVGLISSFIYIVTTNNFSFNLFHLTSDIPFYFFLGGAVGSVIMVLNSLIINNLPAVYVTILVFVGQLFTGIFIDYLQSGSLAVGKIVGGLLILIGLYIYMKGDILKKESESSLNSDL
jgi:transporter family-2 protein